MRRLQTGNRTVVTVQVSRDDVSGFSIMLLRPLGLDVSVGIPDRVYLPATIATFGKVSGASSEPSGGAFADLVEPHLAPVQANTATFWGVALSKLGTYFGWAARGVRIEFVTTDGETYHVTLSYELLPGEHEDWRLIMLDTFLRNGGDSYSAALTERAADRFAGRITTLALPEAS